MPKTKISLTSKNQGRNKKQRSVMLTDTAIECAQRIAKDEGFIYDGKPNISETFEWLARYHDKLTAAGYAIVPKEKT